jgi:prevent-host-death family protein
LPFARSVATPEHPAEAARPVCITRDTVSAMGHVSIRDLRNHGGEIIERAERGERLTITRAGKPVAELVGLPRSPAPLEELRQRWAKLPHVDPAAHRRDVDDVLDPAL